MIGQRSRAFLIAAALCAVFYWFVTRPFMEHSILKVYTTEHATEYAIVGLFFWANCDLLLCALRNRRELQSTRYRWLPTREGIEPVSNAETIYFYVLAAPKAMQSSMMFRRLISAVNYIKERNSAIGFREYLKDLAERDSEEIYSRYSFPRFATAFCRFSTARHSGPLRRRAQRTEHGRSGIQSSRDRQRHGYCVQYDLRRSVGFDNDDVVSLFDRNARRRHWYQHQPICRRSTLAPLRGGRSQRRQRRSTRQAIDKLANLLQEAVRMKRPAA